MSRKKTRASPSPAAAIAIAAPNPAAAIEAKTRALFKQHQDWFRDAGVAFSSTAYRLLHLLISTVSYSPDGGKHARTVYNSDLAAGVGCTVRTVRRLVSTELERVPVRHPNGQVEEVEVVHRDHPHRTLVSCDRDAQGRPVRDDQGRPRNAKYEARIPDPTGRLQWGPNEYVVKTGGLERIVAILGEWKQATAAYARRPLQWAKIAEAVSRGASLEILGEADATPAGGPARVPEVVAELALEGTEAWVYGEALVQLGQAEVDGEDLAPVLARWDLADRDAVDVFTVDVRRRAPATLKWRRADVARGLHAAAAAWRRGVRPEPDRLVASRASDPPDPGRWTWVDDPAALPVWERVLVAAIDAGLREQDVDIWLRPCKAVRLDGPRLTIGPPNVFFSSWIEENGYLPMLRGVVAEVDVVELAGGAP